MAGRIPSDFIDQLLGRTDIVEIIDSRVPLKKTGRDFSACCPFHTEKTPSFTVSATKQFYYCFGCGASGSALGFLMDYEHLEFVEAVEELARLAGLDVPREAGFQRPTDRHPDLADLTERASRFYQTGLRSHNQRDKAVAYLKQRGLDGQTARTFALGYAPPGRDNLLRHLTGRGAKIDSLVTAGLVIAAEDGRRYDRFRDRIIFPIRNRRGHTIAFGARALGDEKPKYLNSPETPLFHKSRELYGLYEVRQHQRQLTRLLVVEGYMDVVALAQHGIGYAVATLGTATTTEHLDQLYRLVSQVIFCFDGDNAGRKAAWTALENALPQMRDGRQAGFLFLPEGEDPDSLIRREGAAAFEQRLLNAQPLSGFLFDTLSGQVNTDTLDGRSRLVELARPLLDRLPDTVFRDEMIENLTRRAGAASAEQLRKRFRTAASPVQSSTRMNTNTVKRTPVRHAIALLLNKPHLAARVNRLDELKKLSIKGMPLLIELLELLQRNPNLEGVSGARLVERYRGSDAFPILERLLGWKPEIPDELIAAEFSGVLDTLLQRFNPRQQLLDKLARGGIDEAEREMLRQLHGDTARPKA